MSPGRRRANSAAGRNVRPLQAHLEGLRTSEARFEQLPVAHETVTVLLSPDDALDVLRRPTEFVKASRTSRVPTVIGDGTASSKYPGAEEPTLGHVNITEWRQERRAALASFLRATDPARMGDETKRAVKDTMPAEAADIDLAAAVVDLVLCVYVRAHFPPQMHAILIEAGRVATSTRQALDEALRSRWQNSHDRDFSWRTRTLQRVGAIRPVTRDVRHRRIVMRNAIDDVIRQAALPNMIQAMAATVSPTDDTSTTARRTRNDVASSAVSLFLAGWENTATACFWALYNLAANPKEQKQLASCITAADRGHQIRLIVMESLRMYPPVWSIGREAIRNAEVGGSHFQKGQVLIIAPWILHYHQNYWEEPYIFRPSRFETGWPRAYMPFGSGDRACPGRNAALAQISSTVDSVAARYTLSLVASHPVPALGNTQYPIGESTIRLCRR